jgi:GT2 family glycosyltransferase
MDKTMQYPKVTIVVITYNNKDIIDENLQSIQKLVYSNYDCILVDDCSTDGTCEYVKGKYPWVKIIKKRINSGVTISKNIGIQQSKSKYILFLDSDVELSEDYLNKCVELMEKNKNIVICGGKLLFKQEPDKINEAGGYLCTIGLAKDRGRGENSLMYNKTEEVFFIGGAAQCVRRDLFDQIGKLDITTSCYGTEDIDICWRARLAGYMVFYNHLAIGYHGYHQTIKKLKQDTVQFHQTKAHIRMLIKNY